MVKIYLALLLPDGIDLRSWQRFEGMVIGHELGVVDEVGPSRIKKA